MRQIICIGIAFTTAFLPLANGNPEFFALLWFLGAIILMYLSKRLNEESGECNVFRWCLFFTVVFGLFLLGCALSPHNTASNDYSDTGTAVLMFFDLIALGISFVALMITGGSCWMNRRRDSASED